MVRRPRRPDDGGSREGPQLALAADYPIDAAYAGLLAFALASASFRRAAPDDSFPVTSGRGGTAAHLDLSVARVDAVRLAVRDQLGIVVREVEPFGLAGGRIVPASDDDR